MSVNMFIDGNFFVTRNLTTPQSKLAFCRVLMPWGATA